MANGINENKDINSEIKRVKRAKLRKVIKSTQRKISNMETALINERANLERYFAFEKQG